MDIEVVFAGLTFLYTKEDKKKTAGEVALLNPSPAHANTEDMKDAGAHNPLLIVRRSNYSGSMLGTQLPEFPLEGAIKSDWLGNKAQLKDYMAWSVDGAVVWLLGDEVRDVKFPLAAAAGLNVKATPANAADWSPIEWVPSINDFFPGLVLADYWRLSPHVASRFLLGGGTVSSAPPIQENAGNLLFTYGNQAKADGRVYSDAIKYQRKTLADIRIVIDRKGSRTIIPMDEHTTQMWVFNLDDPNRSIPSYDHFGLYSLLPWRFSVPKVAGTLSGNHTGGDCWSVRYSE